MSRQHTGVRSARDTASRLTSEDIHLRNYDAETGHGVWINVVSDGRQVFEGTYRLGPGESKSLVNIVPPGEYEVEVGIDGLRREVGRCRIGANWRKTALVEMGNGIVSISEGRY